MATINLQPVVTALPHAVVVNTAPDFETAIERREQQLVALYAQHGAVYDPDDGYKETDNQIRREALADSLQRTPATGRPLSRRKDGKTVFECFHSKPTKSNKIEIRCPMLTMAVQAAMRKCHESGYELVPAVLNFTVTQKQLKSYQKSSPKRGKSVAYLVKEFVRNKLIKIDPEIHIMMILDTAQKEDHAHVHGYLLNSPQKLDALNAALAKARGLERQQSGEPYIKLTYRQKDTRKDSSGYILPVDIGFTGYMALHADKDTGRLDPVMCRKFTELLNEQYDREYERQQATGRKPRQYGAFNLTGRCGQSQFGVSATEKTVLREQFSYKLASDGQGNLILVKFRPDEYFEWKRNAKPGEPIPANMDFSGPESIPIEQRWRARNYGYTRSGGVLSRLVPPTKVCPLYMVR